MAEPTTTPSATLAMGPACSGVRTPKPTATGDLRGLLDPRDGVFDGGQRGGLLAGDARDRDVVEKPEEPSRTAGRRAASVVGVARRIGAMPGAAQGWSKLAVFLGRDIDADHPVDPGLEQPLRRTILRRA